MRRTTLAAGLVLGILAGCRGVLGIEPLELVDGGDATQADAPGNDATNDAGSEATPGTDGPVEAEASVDADAGSPVDAAPDILAICANEGGMNCRPCCKSSLATQTGALIGYMLSSGCICGGGQCAAECDSSLCGAAPGPPPMACANCSDMAVLGPSTISGPCTTAINDCRNDNACAAAIECLQGCH
jgi:hypothetical protein